MQRFSISLVESPHWGVVFLLLGQGFRFVASGATTQPGRGYIATLAHAIASGAATQPGCIAVALRLLRMQHAPYVSISYEMSGLIQYNNLYYLTSTVHQWRPLLKLDEQKQVILNAYQYLSNKNRVVIYAFVILDNHFHLLFEVIPPFTKSKILNSLLGATSTKLIALLDDYQLEQLRVNRSNKKIQFWKPNSLCVTIYSNKFLRQKLNYIHKNVERAGLLEDYYYSSYPSYLSGSSNFDFLTLWG